MKTKIRIFISYSHTDEELVSRLVQVPEDWNIEFIWDKKLVAGFGFHDQIKTLIASSHIFMPIITEESSKRGWVHQEIGFAIAMNIPVLPVATANMDTNGMHQILQALVIPANAQSLESYVSKHTFSRLLSTVETSPLFSCAHVPEERTRMITEYANKVSGMDRSGIVRQKGGLSSFHIPDVNTSSNTWAERYIGHPVSDFHKKNQLKERQALSRHAEKEGCMLIINPNYTLQRHNPRASVSRLKELVSFLTNDKIKVVVAIDESLNDNESLTILGNWFVAESVSFKEGDGFTNTFFTRDAAEIARRIDDFDYQLGCLLSTAGWTKEESRERTIDYLKELVDELSNKFS